MPPTKSTPVQDNQNLKIIFEDIAVPFKQNNFCSYQCKEEFLKK